MNLHAAYDALHDVEREAAVLRDDPLLVTPAAADIAKRRGEEAFAHLLGELAAQVAAPGLQPTDADPPTVPP